MSFPPVYAPGNYSDPAAASCNGSRYQFYCDDSILPNAERLQQWYQYFNLILAATAFSTSVTLSVFIAVWRGRKRQRKSRNARRARERLSSRQQTKRDPGESSDSDSFGSGSPSWTRSLFLWKRSRQSSVSPSDSSSILEKPNFRRSIRTISLHSESDADSEITVPEEYNLRIVPLLSQRHRESDQESPRSSQDKFPANYVGLVDTKKLVFGDFSKTAIAELATQLDLLRLQQGCSGIVVRISGDSGNELVEVLLPALCQKHVSLFLMCDADLNALLEVDFGLLDGIIAENACILPNGDRRDFFLAERLRKVMGRCVEVRVDRPGFFIGFIDLWDVPPSSAVARRAFKLAEYYGAALFHGPTSESRFKGGITTAYPMSLSGFDFLKRPEMTELQKSWSNETRRVDVDGSVPRSDVAPLPLDELECILPQTSTCLQLYELPNNIRNSVLSDDGSSYYPPFSPMAKHESNVFDISRSGKLLSDMGCFPLTQSVKPAQYDSVLETQKHLQELNMLHPLEDVDMLKLTAQLQNLYEITRFPEILETLLCGLASFDIRIYQGMDTGFRADPDSPTQLWAVSNWEDLPDSGYISARRIDIFLSNKVPSIAGAVLHTYLAYSGVPRFQRYEEELMLDHMQNGNEHIRLPTSIQAELDNASESELLSLLSRIGESHMDLPLLKAVRDKCSELLIEDTTNTVWTQTHSKSFLDGSLSIEDLLQMRLDQLAKRGATKLPSLQNLIKLHHALDACMRDAMLIGNRHVLNVLGDALLKAYDPWKSWSTCQFVDVNADLVGLMFFCSLRQAAFEDLYIETTDRCPIFTQPDQAAVFAELWVLGSQCEIYFGILPRAIGEIIFDRYHTHLREANPSPSSWNGKDLFTAYSSLRPENGDIELNQRAYQRFFAFVLELGALSIFCVPAIMDVCLLSFVGRGFFLTAFMSDDDRLAASYALLTSLLIAGGITGWTGSVGGYYLYNHAYHNMNYFLVQRLSAGFVLTLAVALCGLLGLSIQYSARTGAVFVAYLVVLSMYLILLGVLATMHRKNCPMTSGRFVLWRTLPLLVISPILSTLINHHDLLIYLPVIYAFLLSLLLQYRNLCQEWSTWITKVPHVKEADILTWYSNLLDVESDSSSGDEKVKIAVKVDVDAERFFERASTTFARQVELARKNRMNTSNDPLVAKVAAGLPFAQWLLTKDDGSSTNSELFTKTWLVQLDLELKRHEQLIRGLKEHSVFILWRYGKYDLGQNALLFVIALMDHWIALATSSRLPVVSPYTTQRSRFAIGSCLLFFLMSTITVDATLRNYWEKLFALSKERLTDSHHALIVRRSCRAERRVLWLQALGELFVKVLGVLGLTTCLLWLFVNEPSRIILYYLYIAGYSGVLVMSFNRCFTNSVRAHAGSIIIGAVVGLGVGFTLRGLSATAGFIYGEVLALVAASWTAAILTTLWVLVNPEGNGTRAIHRNDESSPSSELHIQKRIGSSKARLDSSYSSVMSKVSGIEVKAADSNNLSTTITKLLELSRRQASVGSIAPWSEEVVQTATRMWTAGRIILSVASRESFVKSGLSDCWTVAQYYDATFRITAGFIKEGDMLTFLQRQPDSVGYFLTESIFHHVAATVLGLGSRNGVLAEHLLQDTVDMPKRIEFQLSTDDEPTLNGTVLRSNARLMRHLCLDIDPDTEWESVPAAIRVAVVNRVAGHPMILSASLSNWLTSSGRDVALEDFCAGLCQRISTFAQRRLSEMRRQSQTSVANPQSDSGTKKRKASLGSRIVWPFRTAWAFVEATVKWIAILSGGASEVERELTFKFRMLPGGKAIVVFLLAGWNICRWVRNIWVKLILIYRRPALQHLTRLTLRGATRTIIENRITVELPLTTKTGFGSTDESGAFTLDVYEGSRTQRPADELPVSTATYSQFQLRSLQETTPKGLVFSTFSYNDARDRWPISKDVNAPDRNMACRYDDLGRIINGVLVIGRRHSEYHFKYHYASHPEFNKDIVRAEYWQLSSPKMLLSVSWGIKINDSKQLDIATPSDRVIRVSRQNPFGVYITTYTYQHKRDPQEMTVLTQGGRDYDVYSPPRLFEDEDELVKKPTNLSFDLDDLLIHHKPTQISGLMRQRSILPSSKLLSKLDPFGLCYYSRKSYHARVPTWRLRTELWRLWSSSKTLDAVTACWLDEMILREERLLGAYWRRRDFGLIQSAKAALDQAHDKIITAIEIPFEVSQVCSLAIKPADLYAMGLGRDANQITNRPEDCYKDTQDRVSVIFNDIGCWPDAPGGVSNCRRDLVEGHKTIRNHVLAEAASEYGISKYQVERNVQSLKVLPLWGLDFKTAHHGLIENLLQSEVDEKILGTDIRKDVIDHFIPLLRRFVKAARTRHPSKADLIDASDALLNMCVFFETKDYNCTWHSKEVEVAWIDAWLHSYNDRNIVDPSDLLGIEKPSISDMKEAMNLYVAALFIYAVQVPSDCPRVFQTTHHGLSSLFGMVLKYRKGTTFGVWDHAILWRESCLNISTAQCLLPVPVQSMYLAGVGLAAKLAYMHVDVIMPCTSVFNPTWEAEIGTDQGRIGSKKSFSRKIDPIVNGIGDVSKFNPAEVRSEKPTVVMLSNVQFIKDIRTAVLSADIIVNQFGFKDYQLLIYGAQDRQPSYTLETNQLIQEKNLSSHVKLQGFGKPSEVLKDAWLFLNSSLSEGLPLAIAEAALTGTPIVATEVGGTSLVLTDPEDKSCRYGEVVPPNDPMSLARAQLNLLAMLGYWTQYTRDVSRELKLPDEFKPGDVEWVTRRMYEKSEDRRRLGLMCRKVVLKGFHGSRYLREHEQMYWIQWHLARMRAEERRSQKVMADCEFPGEWLNGVEEVEQKEILKRRRLQRKVSAQPKVEEV